MSEAEELQKKLEYDLSCVGKGWEPLVRAAFTAAVLLKGKLVQVKEKFGLLRIYADPFNTSLENFITELEHLSSSICERCGTVENVDTRPSRGKFWIKTLCVECRKEEEPSGEGNNEIHS